MMGHINIIISGLGGQGILFMSKILAHTAFNLGRNILGAETHGMAQRGGSVISHLKIGNAQSSLINKGEAHYLLALEENEAYRNLAFISKKGILYVNGDESKVPAYAVQSYLEESQITTRVVQAGQIAMDLAAPLSANLALLGYMSAFNDSPFSGKEMRQSLERVTPERFKAINFKVFDAGMAQGNANRKPDSG